MAPITAPSWHHHGTDHGTITAPSRHRSRHNHGTDHGTITAPSWHHHGTITAPSRHKFILSSEFRFESSMCVNISKYNRFFFAHSQSLNSKSTCAAMHSDLRGGNFALLLKSVWTDKKTLMEYEIRGYRGCWVRVWCSKRVPVSQFLKNKAETPFLSNFKLKTTFSEHFWLFF